jgi:hypothetical protein
MTFQLKTLLIGIGVLGVALYLLVTAPGSVAVPALVAISVTSAALCTAGLAYGGPNVRAFCIGALFPAGSTVIGLVWLLCAWFLIGPYQIQDFPKLLAHFDGLAFTLRVWSGASWLLELLVGLSTLGLKLIFQRKAVKLQKSSGRNASEPMDEQG